MNVQSKRSRSHELGGPLQISFKLTRIPPFHFRVLRGVNTDTGPNLDSPSASNKNGCTRVAGASVGMMLSEELTSPARRTDPPSLPKVWRTSSRNVFTGSMTFLCLLFATPTGNAAWGSENSSYTSYELSLVLPDGRRVSIIHTGWLSRLQTDARELAKLMKLPLWERA